MERIKINEFEYIAFLNQVLSYLKKHKEQFGEDEETNFIESYIEEQLKIRRLMDERKMYYTFYKQNRDRNPQQANLSYQAYLQRKAELETIYNDREHNKFTPTKRRNEK